MRTRGRFGRRLDPDRRKLYFSFGVDFGGVDYASVAGDVGLEGYRVESAEEFRPKLADAVASEGPALVDLPTEPLPEIDDVPVDWLEPDE